MITHPLALRWLICQLLTQLLTGVRRRYIAADFPRRHVLRVRWFRLIDHCNMHPLQLTDTAGATITLTTT